ncbi:peptide chain release factor N(5)-glutamine methyltransferase [Winogradskyella poriferorum]|uniref:peptide chain release factor N(5)-glutamine methyltransferase n=1 Tax=Winogradskyella poriferorum TaxID=307627 RepID=UPI003D661C1E
MKALDLKRIFHKELDGIYGANEVANFFYLCLEHFVKIPKFQLSIDPQFTLKSKETDTFFEVLEELKSQKPIQYILGETEFYGLKFKVNQNVLIPRPETEELVDWIIKSNKSRFEPLKILDIGTGSGCIAVSLAKHLSNAQVYALDISSEALQVAQGNAMVNGTEINFINADILDVKSYQSVFNETSFDIIVSNPPYVRQSEQLEMKPNVLDHEPHLALFVEDNNALVFYKAIIDFATRHLSSNGEIYFEINQYLGEETKQLLIDAHFKNVNLLMDLNAYNRMLKGIK